MSNMFFNESILKETGGKPLACLHVCNHMFVFRNFSFLIDLMYSGIRDVTSKISPCKGSILLHVKDISLKLYQRLI